MIESRLSSPRTMPCPIVLSPVSQPRAAVRVILALALIPVCFCALASAQDRSLKLNDKEYFESRGLNVLVFTNQYNGMFFDEKTAGIEIIHHGVSVFV